MYDEVEEELQGYDDRFLECVSVTSHPVYGLLSGSLASLTDSRLDGARSSLASKHPETHTLLRARSGLAKVWPLHSGSEIASAVATTASPLDVPACQ